MSYDVSIFHPMVKQKFDEGLEMDEFEHLPIEKADLIRFFERLEKYGYELEAENPRSKEFVRQVEGCPIQVAVFDTQISFSVPFWENSKAAIFEALQDATELSDSDGMVLYDKQTGERVL
jgi:hypothetical protein